MTSINIVTKTVGDLLIQHGNGIPDHEAPKGSIYTDNNTAVRYHNVDGSTNWTYNTLIKGVITPPQITSDQNNYNPVGIAPFVLMRLSVDTERIITGINSTGFGDGDLLFLSNISTGNSEKIKLLNDSALSIASNRFLMNGNDSKVDPQTITTLIRDVTSDKFRLLIEK